MYNILNKKERFNRISASIYAWIIKRAFDRLKENNPSLSRGDCYCGITNDLARRQVEHNAKFFKHCKCGSFEVAKMVEEKLHEQGFDTGDQLGNGTNDTEYVYIYVKTKSTRQ